MKKKFKIPKSLKSESISFVSTLIATLIGVFMAIYLTNQGVYEKEKEDTIKLLNTANIITNENLEYVKRFEQMKSLVQDSVSKMSLSFNKSNPLPSTSLLKSILSNDVVSKNLSEYSHHWTYSLFLTTERNARNYYTDAYKNNLIEFAYLMNLEVKYQNGIINLNQLMNKFKSKRDSIYQFSKLMKRDTSLVIYKNDKK